MKTNLIKTALSTAQEEGEFVRVKLPKDNKGNNYYLSTFTGNNNITCISFSIYTDRTYIPIMTVGYFDDMAIGALIEYMYRFYKLVLGVSESELDTAIEENEYIIRYNMIYKRKHRGYTKQIIYGTGLLAEDEF